MKLPYAEGSAFAVPVGEGKFSAGLVARSPRQGKVILCYFFPPYSNLPTLEELHQLNPGDAVLVVRVGDLALMNGNWPIIGGIKTWERERWPIPSFVRREPISGRSWLVHYSDSDPTKIVREEPITGSGVFGDDAVLGTQVVETILKRHIH